MTALRFTVCSSVCCSDARRVKMLVAVGGVVIVMTVKASITLLVASVSVCAFLR